MSFSLKAVQGEAQEIEAEVAASIGHDREQRVLDIVKQAVKDIARELGGYIAISGNGHINEDEGQPGDNVSLTVNSLPSPDAPTPSGLVPPEASVAAQQTADGSPPAPVPPVPQPDPSAVPAAEPTPPAAPSEPAPTPDSAQAPQQAPAPASGQTATEPPAQTTTAASTDAAPAHADEAPAAPAPSEPAPASPPASPPGAAPESW